MIIGIGCDIVEHRMTKKLKWNSDTELLKRILSPKELELYYNNQTVKFISGRFAVKEAVIKCLGTGMQDEISLADIQILKGKTGKPELELMGEVKKISNDSGISLWHVSITHSTSYSLGFVIAEGFKN